MAQMCLRSFVGSNYARNLLIADLRQRERDLRFTPETNTSMKHWFMTCITLCSLISTEFYDTDVLRHVSRLFGNPK